MGFFRFVRFRGGRIPYLEWQSEGSLPIVIMTPNVKLVEGPDFAFGARWTLMQHHPWESRKEFLEMTDDEVKIYFRSWRLSEECPWYVVDQYLSENGSRARGGMGPLFFQKRVKVVGVNQCPVAVNHCLRQSTRHSLMH